MFTPLFSVIPQIHISNGAARVPHFEPGFTKMDDDAAFTTPEWVARRWVELGAVRLQVVDDDAEVGRPSNSSSIKRLVRSVRDSARVDLVAGIRDQASLRVAAETGAHRLVLEPGVTSAPDWLEAAVAAFGERISGLISIDDHGRAQAVTSPNESADDLLPALEAAGIGHFLVREPNRSGHWWQRHHQALAEFCRRASGSVTAGTPVEKLEQLHELCELVPLGLDGAVMGHALDDGSMTFAEAQAAAEARFDPYEWGPAQP